MRKERRDWPSIIQEQEASGISVPEYCKAKGIHPNTFYVKRKRQNGNGLVEITPEPKGAMTPIFVQTKRYSLAIRNGFEPETLKAVLEVIGELE